MLAHIPASVTAALGYDPSLAPSLDPFFVLVTPVPTSLPVPSSVTGISPASMDSVLLILFITVPPGAPESAVSLPSHP